MAERQVPQCPAVRVVGCPVLPEVAARAVAGQAVECLAGRAVECLVLQEVAALVLECLAAPVVVAPAPEILAVAAWREFPVECQGVPECQVDLAQGVREGRRAVMAKMAENLAALELGRPLVLAESEVKAEKGQEGCQVEETPELQAEARLDLEDSQEGQVCPAAQGCQALRGAVDRVALGPACPEDLGCRVVLGCLVVARGGRAAEAALGCPAPVLVDSVARRVDLE